MNQANELTFSDAEKKVLKEQYPKLNDHEFEAFISAAQRYRLNPLANQIYAQVRFSKNKKTGKVEKKVAYCTNIDGYRLVADRTGAYAGNDDPVFDDESKPKKASVTVYKIVGGQRCGFTASARWDQYFPGPELGFMWNRMPHLMLGKCAEALALRKAFPADLAGIYVDEERQRVDITEPFDATKVANGEEQPIAPAIFNPRNELVVAKGKMTKRLDGREDLAEEALKGWRCKFTQKKPPTKADFDALYKAIDAGDFDDFLTLNTEDNTNAESE